VLGHVGARGTALWNVVLLDEMFDLDEIRIASRRPESREAFGRHPDAPRRNRRPVSRHERRVSCVGGDFSRGSWRP
jgi:alanine dehydrogenase